MTELWQVRLLTTWDYELVARIIPLLHRDTSASTRRYRAQTVRRGVVCWRSTWDMAFAEWWRIASMWCYDEARIDTN